MATNCNREVTTFSITVPESEAERIISDPSYAQELVLKLKQVAANTNIENVLIDGTQQHPIIANTITLPADSITVPADAITVPQETTTEVFTESPIVYKKRDKIFNWNNRLTTMLITLRLQMEQEFKHPTACKKADLWDKISLEMQKATASAYGLTGMICDSKWRNLLTTYRKLRDTYKTRKERRRNWEYFDQLEVAYGEEIDNPSDKSDVTSTEPVISFQLPSSSSSSTTMQPAKRQKTGDNSSAPEWFLAYRREERFSEDKRRKEEKDRLDRLEKIEQQKIAVLNEFNTLLRMLIEKNK